MDKVLCSWCGKNFPKGNAYYPSLIGTLSLGVLGLTPFCSKRCLTFYKNNKSKDRQKGTNEKSINIKNEQAEIELDYLKKSKKIELDAMQQKQKLEVAQQKSKYAEEKKNSNIQSANEYLANGGNKFVYNIKYIWAILDKPWKKILVLFIIWAIIAGIADKLMK